MIDWTHVHALRTDMEGGFDDLVEVFLEEMDGAMTRLDLAVDPESMAASLHFLKGAALNLGFQEFALICDAGETRATGGHSVATEPVRSAYARSRAEFVAGLAHGKLPLGGAIKPENSPAFRPE